MKKINEERKRRRRRGGGKNSNLRQAGFQNCHGPRASLHIPFSPLLNRIVLQRLCRAITSHRIIAGWLWEKQLSCLFKSQVFSLNGIKGVILKGLCPRSLSIPGPNFEANILDFNPIIQMNETLREIGGGVLYILHVEAI